MTYVMASVYNELNGEFNNMNNLVFFDIDGTLAIRTNVPASAEKALEIIRANGDKVFICTGRNPAYVRKNFSAYADGFICSNGRMAFMGDEILYDHPVSKEQLIYIAEELSKVGGGWLFNAVNHGYYGGEDEGFEVLNAVQHDGYAMKETDPDKMDPVYALDVWFHSVDQRLEMEKALEGVCLLNPHGPHPTADVTVLGIDKGTALLHVAEKLGVPLENTYAFGDGVNDLCMIEAAGHGIAMGNAVDTLKEKAEFITTPILEDGVYNGLKHYNLI